MVPNAEGVAAVLRARTDLLLEVVLGVNDQLDLRAMALLHALRQLGWMLIVALQMRDGVPNAHAWALLRGALNWAVLMLFHWVLHTRNKRQWRAELAWAQAAAASQLRDEDESIKSDAQAAVGSMQDAGCEAGAGEDAPSSGAGTSGSSSQPSPPADSAQAGWATVAGSSSDFAWDAAAGEDPMQALGDTMLSDASASLFSCDLVQQAVGEQLEDAGTAAAGAAAAVPPPDAAAQDGTVGSTTSEIKCDMEDLEEWEYRSPFEGHVQLSIKLNSEMLQPEDMPADTLDRLRDLVLQLSGRRLLVVGGAMRPGCVTLVVDAVLLGPDAQHTDAAAAAAMGAGSGAAGQAFGAGGASGVANSTSSGDGSERTGASAAASSKRLLLMGDMEQWAARIAANAAAVLGAQLGASDVRGGDQLDQGQQQRPLALVSTTAQVASVVAVHATGAASQAGPCLAQHPDLCLAGPCQPMVLHATACVGGAGGAGAPAATHGNKVVVSVPIRHPTGLPITSYQGSRRHESHPHPDTWLPSTAAHQASSLSATVTPSATKPALPPALLAVRCGHRFIHASVLAVTPDAAPAKEAGVAVTSNVQLEISVPTGLSASRPLAIELWAGGVLLAVSPVYLRLTLPGAEAFPWGPPAASSGQTNNTSSSTCGVGEVWAGAEAEELAALAAVASSRGKQEQLTCCLGDLGALADMLDEVERDQEACARNLAALHARRGAPGTAADSGSAARREAAFWQRRAAARKLVAVLTRYAARNGLRVVAQNLLGACLSESGKVLLGGNHWLVDTPGMAERVLRDAVKSGSAGMVRDVAWWVFQYGSEEQLRQASAAAGAAVSSIQSLQRPTPATVAGATAAAGSMRLASGGACGTSSSGSKGLGRLEPTTVAPAAPALDGITSSSDHAPPSSRAGPAAAAQLGEGSDARRVVYPQQPNLSTAAAGVQAGMWRSLLPVLVCTLAVVVGCISRYPQLTAQLSDWAHAPMAKF